MEIKCSQYELTLPWEWYYDDAETSALNANFRLIIIIIIVIIIIIIIIIIILMKNILSW